MALPCSPSHQGARGLKLHARTHAYTLAAHFTRPYFVLLRTTSYFAFVSATRRGAQACRESPPPSPHMLRPCLVTPWFLVRLSPTVCRVGPPSRLSLPISSIHAAARVVQAKVARSWRPTTSRTHTHPRTRTLSLGARHCAVCTWPLWAFCARIRRRVVLVQSRDATLI